VQLKELERWISTIRLIAVPVAALGVGVASGYPNGTEAWAWATIILFATGSVTLFALTRMERGPLDGRKLALASQVFDTAIVCAFALIFSFERGIPSQQLLYLALAAGCVRFEIAGGLAVVVVSIPVVALFEKLRTDHLGTPFSWKFVVFQVLLELMMALIVGLLVRRLATETQTAHDRAEEAEELRDELARRADLVDAANRCARALGSSLELSEAFGAFIRELQGLIRFDRIEIVLAGEGTAHVMATAGAGSDNDDDLPTGRAVPLEHTLVAEVVRGNQPIVRPRLDPAEYPEEAELIALGLKSRLAAPLLSGARTIGMLSVARAREDAFDEGELELLALLGRLVASAVQNIYAYEAERVTVEELQRLTALRADFVSLVSHELRTPMAAVIGSARTLQGRWAELSTDQRDSLLDLIAGETSRLTDLVAEVLDTSRIDAGTFSFTFADVDLGALVEDTVASTALGRDGVRITANVAADVPTVSGDEVRLRQVLANLIDNAVKYSGDDREVEVRVSSVDGVVLVDVSDHGGGIAPEDHELIFERFGRVAGTASKPGTGLGLYIARSIVESHGGSLEVTSQLGQGATFTIALPATRIVEELAEPHTPSGRGAVITRASSPSP
jgi:signal transduction histidine kinase